MYVGQGPFYITFGGCVKSTFANLIVLMIFLIMGLVSEGRIAGEFFSVFRQIQDADSILSDSLGSGRMAIWKATIRELPKYWLFGCGIEKYSVITDFDTMRGSLDAHNGYLGIWMEQGVFAIVSYLLFLFSLFIPAILSFWKQHEYETDFVTKAAFLTFFGYIAQDFVNINVLQVVPYFWPICGLLFLQKKQERDK